MITEKESNTNQDVIALLKKIDKTYERYYDRHRIPFLSGWITLCS